LKRYYFTHILRVRVYAKLQSFILLSLNLTKLCHIKRDHNHPEIVHVLLAARCIVTTDFIAKYVWPPNSPDLNPLDYCA